MQVINNSAQPAVRTEGINKIEQVQQKPENSSSQGASQTPAPASTDQDAVNKIGSTDTIKKLSMFGDDMKTAKALINDIMAGGPKAMGAEMKFQKLINSMSDDELLDLSKHINDLMKNTDGQDQTLGRLQNMVLNEIGDMDWHSIPTPQPMPHFPPFHDPDGDGFTNLKYSCVYASRNKTI